MAHFKLSHLSTQDVLVPVTAQQAGEAIDPTSMDVYLAVVARGALPADDDWIQGRWETAGPLHSAVVLIGPNGGDLAPSPGFYDIWVKVIAETERPVLPSGTIQIT